ncbi:hypothetical protein C8E05_4529 [Rhodococcus wratislaviensis]|uniref:Uncharacterized protein n=1 Tax=Rhodococcus wratislaviensis TaxID=44752 RepID=A0AB38FE85_RHOWR|nr:hypothetical protein C8E05_4529 [Rhodococcus wratislaviensis]SPZ39898.1 Uncharacterised protein [Rhodococcus wratislaviensis]
MPTGELSLPLQSRRTRPDAAEPLNPRLDRTHHRRIPRRADRPGHLRRGGRGPRRGPPPELCGCGQRPTSVARAWNRTRTVGSVSRSTTQYSQPVMGSDINWEALSGVASSWSPCGRDSGLKHFPAVSLFRGAFRVMAVPRSRCNARRFQSRRFLIGGTNCGAITFGCQRRKRMPGRVGHSHGGRGRLRDRLVAVRVAGGAGRDERGRTPPSAHLPARPDRRRGPGWRHRGAAADAGADLCRVHSHREHRRGMGFGAGALRRQRGPDIRVRAAGCVVGVGRVG